MKKMVVSLIVSAVIVFFVQVATAQNQVLYVALNGNDSWSGQLPNPNTNSSDGPFQSFDRMLTALEKINATQQGGTITVNIRGGVYNIDHTLELLNKHASGSNTCVIQNYNNEQVIITGAKAFTQLGKITDPTILNRIPQAARPYVIAADLKANGITSTGIITKRGRPGMELFSNDQRLQLARWPNQGWASIEDVPPFGNSAINNGRKCSMPTDVANFGRFQYQGNAPTKWTNISNILLHGYWDADWFDEILRIQSIDTVNRQITIQPPHSAYGYCKQQRFFALNVLEELDTPGEWYLDSVRNAVYLWPLQPSGKIDLYASMLENPLVTLTNTNKINITGLHFERSRGTAIAIYNGNNNQVAGCSFRQLGDVAVLVKGGSNNCIMSSDIFDVAGGAVSVTGGDRKSLTPGNNCVTNNEIYETGKWIRTDQIAVTVSGVGNTVAHNRIHDIPFGGIRLYGNENIIEYNELFNIATETGDVGGFYIGRDWTERGNKVRYNYFHDLNGVDTHDVNAIYLDDFASGTTIDGNIFSSCATGVKIGGGRDNIIQNNFFIGCAQAIFMDSRGTGWAKSYISGNVKTLYQRMDAINFQSQPYATQYPELLTLYTDSPGIPKNNHILHNIFYKGNWLELRDKLDFTIVDVKNNIIADAQKSYSNPQDNIVTGNPGFMNPDQNDYRLNNNLLKAGYQNIPLKNIGLQQDAYRPNPQRAFNFK